MNYHKPMKEFLELYKDFNLGKLTTESFHDDTKNLSFVAQENLPQAIKKLSNVDDQALEHLIPKLEEIFELSETIHSVLRAGKKVFLCGCGATGRLSIALETFWRRMNPGNDQVVSFMAGGDYALVRSVESFEDNSSFGARQLKELGHQQGDLFIGVTEGGETSFVIGATIEASKSGDTWFLYCNPDSELSGISRSRRVLENKSVNKLNLSVGPMAISGSTRMQASTVQMLALSFALFFPEKEIKKFKQKAFEEINNLKKLDAQFLSTFIELEEQVYKGKGHVNYLSNAANAITILTDTTERSPTFNLIPFEQSSLGPRSLSFLTIAGEPASESAWNSILNRTPRGLNWQDLPRKLDLDEIYQFDFSNKVLDRRPGEVFKVLGDECSFSFEFRNAAFNLRLPSDEFVINQIALKMLMNIHSTLVMCRMDRVYGNMMTYVRPSNYKLVDRATRYVLEIASRQNVELDYLTVATDIIERSGNQKGEKSVVLESLDLFLNK